MKHQSEKIRRACLQNSTIAHRWGRMLGYARLKTCAQMGTPQAALTQPTYSVFVRNDYSVRCGSFSTIPCLRRLSAILPMSGRSARPSSLDLRGAIGPRQPRSRHALPTVGLGGQPTPSGIAAGQTGREFGAYLVKRFHRTSDPIMAWRRPRPRSSRPSRPRRSRRRRSRRETARPGRA